MYQHPLAYLLGLEGIALLRAFAGEYDRDFTEARLAQIQHLLDSAPTLGEGSTAAAISTMDGYRAWAAFYDLPGNQLIGVDSSPDMLAIAQAKIPDGEFYCGDMHRLPVPDAEVDVVVCGLALMHVPDLDAVFAEFVRVLKPGGHLVISDWRALLGTIAFPVVRPGPDGRPGFIPSRTRLTSEYLSAALALGLHLRRCDEPLVPYPLVDCTGTPPSDTEPLPAAVPDTPPDIWSLHLWCPDATNAAYRREPAAIVFDFQLADSRETKMVTHITPDR
ncbi:MAG: class I SAM-dependent methyltransferase [Nocardioidaceae bacterium]